MIGQLHDIIKNNDRCVNDLTCSRISPRGPHSIRDRSRNITNTRVFQIIRIKSRIILREIPHLDHVLQPDLLESNIPTQSSLPHGFLPHGRKSIIHIKHDRFHGFHQLTSFIGLHIFRFHPPAIGQRVNLNPVLVGRNMLFRIRNKHPNPGITHPWMHLLFRQQQQSTGCFHRQRLVFLHNKHPHHLGRHGIGKIRLYRHVIIKSLNSIQNRTRTIKHGCNLNHSTSTGNRCQSLRIARKQRGHIKQKSRTIVRVAIDFI